MLIVMRQELKYGAIDSKSRSTNVGQLNYNVCWGGSHKEYCKHMGSRFGVLNVVKGLRSGRLIIKQEMYGILSPHPEA